MFQNSNVALLKPYVYRLPRKQKMPLIRDVSNTDSTPDSYRDKTHTRP